MRIGRVFVGLTVVAALCFGASGCKQGTGERCQVDSDCSSGLKCYTGLSQSVPPEGECQSIDFTGPQDAGVADDAAPQADAAEDAAVQADALQADATQEDATQEDAQTD